MPEGSIETWKSSTLILTVKFIFLNYWRHKAYDNDSKNDHIYFLIDDIKMNESIKLRKLSNQNDSEFICGCLDELRW